MPANTVPSLTCPFLPCSCFAHQQAKYILGENPLNMSLLVGYGASFPLHVHHRGASCAYNYSTPCSWDNFAAPTPNPLLLWGALVGGPTDRTDFSYQDVRSNPQANEAAMDYGSGGCGCIAAAACLPRCTCLPACAACVQPFTPTWWAS